MTPDNRKDDKHHDNGDTAATDAFTDREVLFELVENNLFYQFQPIFGYVVDLRRGVVLVVVGAPVNPRSRAHITAAARRLTL
jgi:hypothetical protein